MLVVYGAGSVGLVLGARLARAGERVLFVTRRREVAERIQSEGVRLEDPASGEAFDVGVDPWLLVSSARRWPKLPTMSSSPRPMRSATQALSMGRSTN